MQGKYLSILIVYILLSISVVIYFSISLPEYVNVMEIPFRTPLIILMILTLFFVINIENDKHFVKKFWRVLIPSSLFTFGLLLTFALFKPHYTFYEAQEIILQNEGGTKVENVSGQQVVPSISEGNFYLITIHKDNKKLFYTFNPNSGEYMEFN